MSREALEDASQDINIGGLGLRMGRVLEKDILFIFVFFFSLFTSYNESIIFQIKIN